MEEEKLKRALLENFGELVSNWKPVAPGEKAGLVEILFAYRILLGRMPRADELASYSNHSMSLRGLLEKFCDAQEYCGRLDFLPGGLELMSEANGFKFWFDTSDRQMGSRMGAGLYEEDTVKLVKRLIKPGMICLDVGAQTGFYTCLFAQLVTKSGNVISFEPLPRSFELLNKNVAANDFDDRVETQNVACTDEGGELRASIASRMVVAAPSGRGGHVFKSICLDDLKLSQVDFCKIDIEGHEPKAVRGMWRTLQALRPMILTEINEYWLGQGGSSGAEYIAMIKELGYRLFDTENAMAEILTYEPSANPLAVSNLLAIHASQRPEQYV
jgi:FkbM family methyltransferase